MVLNFKEKALETFLSNINEKIELTVFETEMVKYAFMTGFNMGAISEENESMQEIALKALSLYGLKKR